MKRLSFRWLLLGSVLATMTFALAVSAVLIDRVERSNRIADIDEELTRASNAPAVGRPPPQRDELDVIPVEDNVGAEAPASLLLAPDGRILDVGAGGSPFDQATLVTLARSSGSRTVASPHYRVRTRRMPDGATAVTALSLVDFDAAVWRFRVALAAGEGAALLLVAGVLFVVTGYLARPVTEMAAVATRIADGQLDTSIGPPSGSRETADLALDLDRMLMRLRTALADANASRELTERFLADMAHEIRTPLTALKGYSDLYSKGMLEETADVDRAMERIGSESERLADLADGMLQLARSGFASDKALVVDIGDVVVDVVQDLRAAYPEQRIDIDVASPRGSEVDGVRSKLHQAILNLGSNACHHNPAPRPILVGVHSSDDVVEVTVTDHGDGVAEADADRIFRPFFRSDEARDRDGQAGAGLGLALTKQIAEQHGGSVTVAARPAELSADSRPASGAVFTLRLPLSQANSVGTQELEK